MRRTSFADTECPIALGLEAVGEWWTILILRDVFDGFSRFDDLQRNLGISPSMLARRLKALVDAGLLERRRYSERPPRDEYVLTERGAAFRPVHPRALRVERGPRHRPRAQARARSTGTPAPRSTRWSSTAARAARSRSSTSRSPPARTRASGMRARYDEV